jgi:hypothetical protein
MPPANRRQRRSGGLGKVAEAASKQRGKTKWLKLDDGDVVRVRVVAEQFKDAWVHRVPMETEDEKGRARTFHAEVPCLDQDDEGVPCPGCKDDIAKKYKFYVPVIVRDWTDEETGKTGDTVMLWSNGITIGKKLDKLEAKHGLANRDIEIEREGSTMNDTRYDVDWAEDSNSELTAEEKELVEKAQIDLKRYVEPPEFDDFYVPLSERNKKDEGDPGQESIARRGAFSRRDAKDDDKPARTRRSSASAKPAGLAGFGKKKDGDSNSSKTTTRRTRRS